MDIDLPPNSRSFIAGQTGSGKTYLAKSMFNEVTRLIVIDSKYNLAKDLQLQKASKKNWRYFLRGFPMRLQIKPPKWATARQVMAYCENVFKLAERAANCVVYIDEAMHITIPAVDPPNLKGLYTRGREAVYNDDGVIIAGNIGVVAASQRPARIPLFMITESENRFCFRLTHPEDRKLMSGYMSDVNGLVREPIPDMHGFYHYRNDMGSAEPIYVEEL